MTDRWTRSHRVAVVAILGVAVVAFHLTGVWSPDAVQAPFGAGLKSETSQPLGRANGNVRADDASLALCVAERVSAGGAPPSIAAESGGPWTVQLVFAGDPLPPRWQLQIDGNASDQGKVSHLNVRVPNLPVRATGSWHGATLFDVALKEPGCARIDISACYEMVLRAPPGANAEGWLCYSCSPPPPGDRTFAYERSEFGKSGEFAVRLAMDQDRQFVVWAKEKPLFCYDTRNLASRSPWAVATLEVQHGVPVPIRGRITDRSGVPVKTDVSITALFPEAWGNGDYMILDGERARARGGFSGTARPDAAGCFSLYEVSPEADQLFHVALASRDRRMLSPTRMLRTIRGGTWVDIVVE